MEKFYLADIFERVIVKSGQFLLPTESIELDETKFAFLVDDALEIYNKYCPLDREIDIESTAGRKLPFSTTSDYGIPEEIVAVTPTRVYAVSPYWIAKRQPSSLSNDNLEEVSEVPFKYVKPDLYIPFNGRWRVHALYHYEIMEEENDEGDIQQFIPYMTLKERYFFELIRGMFIQGIGRSRRAFTLNDLPIAMDAAELVGEGVEIQERAEENITSSAHKYWLAFGGGK